MAGEKRGALAEAIIIAAIQRLSRHSIQRGDLHWGKKPSGMSIDTDVVVGDLDAPEIVVLITSTGSEKESNRKFWRNLGEMAEMKTQLASVPQAVSVVFTDRVKPNIKLLGAATFDRQVVVEDEPWGQVLIGVLDRLERHAPADDLEKLQVVDTLARTDAEFSAAIEALGGSILDERDEDDVGASLWLHLAARAAPSPPAGAHTHFRRGIGKLLLFPGVVATKGRLLPAKSADAALALATGMARKTLRGVELTDLEILWVLQNFSAEEIEAVAAAQPRERMSAWIAPLLALPTLEERANWIVEHWGQLSDPAFMLRSLEACHSDPSSLGPPAAGDNQVWLFHLLVDLFKSATGSQQGYGLSVLLEEMDRSREQPEHRSVVKRLAMDRGVPNVVWRDNRGISLGLADWANGPSAQRFPIYSDDLARVAAILARRCGEIDRNQAQTAADTLREVVIRTNLEARVLTYRLLDPLGALVRRALDAHGLGVEDRPYESACFAQYAAAMGASIDPRAGGTSGVVCNRAFIKWQSCTDLGRDHKKKELCGRVAALRFEWNRGFRPRAGIERFVLVLDGTWRQSDLDALVRAGWDEIYYPDEMDKLVQSLV